MVDLPNSVVVLVIHILTPKIKREEKTFTCLTQTGESSSSHFNLGYMCTWAPLGQWVRSEQHAIMTSWCRGQSHATDKGQDCELRDKGLLKIQAAAATKNKETDLGVLRLFEEGRSVKTSGQTRTRQHEKNKTT